MSAHVEVLALLRRRGALSTLRIAEALALSSDELRDALAILRQRNLVALEPPDALRRVIVLPIRDADGDEP